MTDFEEHVGRRARAIDPYAWQETPPATFTGIQPKGMARDDVIKAWWHGNHERRRKSLRQARATFAADREAGFVLVPEKATEEMEAVADKSWKIGWSGWGPLLNAAIAAGAVEED